MSGSTPMIPYQGFLRWLCLFFLVVLAFAFAFFVLMMIFQPQELKFTVTYASLAEFSLSKIDDRTNNNTLSYNLTIDVAIRNPNKKVGVYFDRIEATANYGEELRLARLNSVVAPFYQGHKNTTTFRAVFEGRRFVTFEEYRSEIDRYNFEKSLGIFSIEVKINVRMRARYGKIRTGHFKHPKIDCELKVPLLSKNGTYSVIDHDFEATRCGDD